MIQISSIKICKEILNLMVILLIMIKKNHSQLIKEQQKDLILWQL